MGRTASANPAASFLTINSRRFSGLKEDDMALLYCTINIRTIMPLPEGPRLGPYVQQGDLRMSQPAPQTGETVQIRRARPEDLTVCAQICYDAFYKINTDHRFPPDFPSL